MYRYIVVIVMALMIVLPAAAGAAEKKSKEQYWGNLKGKVQGITPRKQASVTTAVGGVRGAKDEGAESVYWKGREHADIDEEELLKFNTAVDFAINGENGKAQKVLEDFLTTYPDSPLRVDALEALAAVKGEPDTATPVEPAKEAAPAAVTEPAKEAAPAAAEPAKEAAPAAPAKEGAK